jgi:hypothetical protein
VSDKVRFISLQGARNMTIQAESDQTTKPVGSVVIAGILASSHARRMKLLSKENRYLHFFFW